jgi:hypothetical protein
VQGSSASNLHLRKAPTRSHKFWRISPETGMKSNQKRKKNPPQCLHHQMLNFIHRQPRLIRNHLKTHTTIIRMSLEHCLNKRHETDLLSQEAKVFLQNRLKVNINYQQDKGGALVETVQRTVVDAYLFGEERRKSLEFPNIPFVECEKELLEPFVLSLVQRVQNRMHELQVRFIMSSCPGYNMLFMKMKHVPIHQSYKSYHPKTPKY